VRCSTLLLAVLFLLPTTLRAQPLADRLPPSALVYTGWQPKPEVLTTRAALMLADPRIATPWRLLLQRLVLDLPNDLGAAAPGDRISQHFPLLLAEAAQCEGCFSLLELRHDKDDLIPQAVLLIKLGEHRKAFEEHFKPIHQRLTDRLGDRVHMLKLENSWLWEKAGADRPEYTWGFVGDWFVFYLGDRADTFLPTLSRKLDKSLADSPDFTDCMGKVPGNPADAVITTYVNVAAATELLHTLMKATNDEGLLLLVDRWPKVMAQLGLDNATALGERTTIEHGQFVTRTLLRTKGEPHGLLAAVVQPAVDDAMLKAIPPDAMFAVALRADLSKAYDQLKDAIVAIAGEDGRKSFAEIEDAAAGFGVPVKTLLAPLGDQWVVYEAASTGGFFFTGLTFVVDVRDPKQLGRTLLTLQDLLSKQVNGEQPAGVGSYVVDGVTIHYLEPRGFNFFTPAWAVADNKLFVALYPQVVEDAVHQLKADKSLLDNPDFASGRQQTVGGAGGGGPLAYISGPEWAKSLYPLVLPFTAGIRELFTEGQDHDLPVAELLPSLQRLLKYIGPDVVSVRLTPDGVLRTKTVANPLLSPLTVTDSVPLWVAAALPSLGQAKVNADRVKSAANLRQIGQALILYAGNNNGQLPPDLATALKTQDLSPDSLHSPFAPGKDNTGYRYLHAAGTKDVPPDVAIAYDAAELQKGDGANVLYGDGHVEWLDQAGVKEVLEKTSKWKEGKK
jgi:prepilin-type processing-associated H-X9-DG protein